MLGDLRRQCLELLILLMHLLHELIILHVKLSEVDLGFD